MFSLIDSLGLGLSSSFGGLESCWSRSDRHAENERRSQDGFVCENVRWNEGPLIWGMSHGINGLNALERRIEDAYRRANISAEWR